MDDQEEPMIEKVRRAAAVAARFLGYCLKRFLDDGGPRTAAALSYSSLLALVPLLAIAFAALSVFEGFADLRAELQNRLVEAFLPQAAQVVGDHLTSFVSNASQMTGPGLAVLALTAILLLNTITSAFSEIWRASEPRPLVLRILVYWAILSLGPLLLGASLSVSTYAFATVQWAGLEAVAEPVFGLAWLLPFLLAVLGFTLLFLIVPNRSVRRRHALAGAVVAASLFELLKKGFGLYLAHFPSYQAIYGALAVVPIFLIWTYLSWAALLIGAEIAAALPEWRAAERRGEGHHGPGARLALALAMLGRLRRASREGQILSEKALSRHLPATLRELDDVLGALRRGRYVVRSGLRRWVLARDLSTVTLNNLIDLLGLSLEPGRGWPDSALAAIRDLAAERAERGGTTLAEILDDRSDERAAALGLERLA